MPNENKMSTSSLFGESDELKVGDDKCPSCGSRPEFDEDGPYCPRCSDYEAA